MRRLVAGMALIFAAGFAAAADAAELVMFERAGCVWCIRWDAEIAPAYGKTEEAKRAPLRRVDVMQRRPDDLAAVRPVVYTPTFVLVDEGKEIGRIEGYRDEAFFYGYLDRLLARLPAGR